MAMAGIFTGKLVCSGQSNLVACDHLPNTAQQLLGVNTNIGYTMLKKEYV